jgi:hypothetical protein
VQNQSNKQTNKRNETIKDAKKKGRISEREIAEEKNISRRC